MKKTILYFILPLSVLAVGLFFILRNNSKYLASSSYISENTLAIIHLPNVNETINSLNNKSVFQHLLQFEGLNQLKKLIEPNKETIKANKEANLSVCIIEAGEYLLILDEGKEAEIEFEINDFAKEGEFYVYNTQGLK